MKKTEIRKLLNYYKILYPASKLKIDNDTVSVWCDVFQNYDYLNTKKALREVGFEISYMPGPYDIARKLESDTFKKSLFDTYEEYPYEVTSKRRNDFININVSFNDFDIDFKYSTKDKDRATDLINLLKEHPTKCEIMCLWDEEMAGGNYGSCRKEYGI